MQKYQACTSIDPVGFRRSNAGHPYGCNELEGRVSRGEEGLLPKNILKKRLAEKFATKMHFIKHIVFLTLFEIKKMLQKHFQVVFDQHKDVLSKV